MIDATLETSRKNTFAALNSRAIAVPSVMMIATDKMIAIGSPGPGSHPVSRQTTTRMIICGITW